MSRREQVLDVYLALMKLLEQDVARAHRLLPERRAVKIERAATQCVKTLSVGMQRHAKVLDLLEAELGRPPTAPPPRGSNVLTLRPRSRMSRRRS